jgi:hypothetical protein
MGRSSRERRLYEAESQRAKRKGKKEGEKEDKSTVPNSPF